MCWYAPGVGTRVKSNKSKTSRPRPNLRIQLSGLIPPVTFQSLSSKETATMNSWVGLLGVTLLLIVSWSGRAEGVSCWVCMDIVDKQCSDTFPAEERLTVVKTDCGTESVCSKTVVKVGKSSSKLTRACLPKIPGMDEGCKSVTVGDTENINCVCSSDLCNGAEGPKDMRVLLTTTTLLLLAWRQLNNGD